MPKPLIYAKAEELQLPLTIGYSGYSINNLGTADRRRILYWAAVRGHKIVKINDSSADVRVITSSSDLEFWRNHKSNVPLVLDVVDGLLAEKSPFKDYLRAVSSSSKFGLSKIRSTQFSKLITEVAQKSNSVICSCREQSVEWNERGVRPHEILDFHEEFPEISNPKRPSMETINLFWEGLPVTLNALSNLSGIFEDNKDKIYHLNLLTQKKSFKFKNRFVPISTSDLVTSQVKSTNLKFKVWDWSVANCAAIAQRSHLGVIPLSLSTGYHRLKAENRLLIMWRLGLNTLTSPLDSYSRVMKSADIDGICSTNSDWSEKHKEILNSEDLRIENLEKARSYLSQNHNREILLKKWDSVFERL